MGETVVGVVEALDERTAAASVREMGHLPMEIRPAKGVTKAKPAAAEAGNVIERYLISPLWTGVNIKMLALFYRQLATLLASGMGISEALASIGRRQRGRLGIIVHEMRQNVIAGGRLSDTMSRYPRIFSRLQLALIRAGESGGLLEQMIDRIASYLEYELSIRKLIMKATAYPIVTLVLALVVCICVPHISVLVNDGLSPFFVLVWPQFRLWIFMLIGLVIVMKLVFQFSFVRLIWDAIKVQPPVVGSTARQIAMSRFSRALAVLYAAGMSFSESVDIASDACANLHIGRRMKYAIPAIQSGEGLTESLAKTRAVSPMVLDMLEVGEKSGSSDAALQKVADYMDEEVDASIHKLGIALFVIMIMAAGVVVGYIVVDFWQKYYGGMSRPGI